MEFKGTKEQAAHEYFKQGQLGFQKAADTETAFLKGCIWYQKNSKAPEMLEMLKKLTEECDIKELAEEAQQLIKEATEL